MSMWRKSAVDLEEGFQISMGEAMGMARRQGEGARVGLSVGRCELLASGTGITSALWNRAKECLHLWR